MLSFKDNFEVNNEIKDVTETFEAPEHILLIQFVGLEETACVYFCFSEFSLQKTPEPLSFLTPGSFPFGALPAATCKEPSDPSGPSPVAVPIHASSYSLHSKM